MRNLIFCVLAIMISGCKTNETVFSDTPLPATLENANTLAKKFAIVDGHVDLPYRLHVKNFKLEKDYIGIPISTDEGDFDFERSIEGGLDAPFMSIYIPSDKQSEKGLSKSHAEGLIDMIEGICKTHPDKFEIAKTPSDVERIKKEGKVALPMGMENGSGIEDDIKNVSYFKKRGISYITLTHAKVNLICDSSYDPERKWGGLSPFGERVVQEMNRVGIMIDISHVSDSTFYDVMKISKLPVIASHSSARHYTPGFERNMSDDLIKRLAINGGVIMINFGSTFIDAKSRESSDKTKEMLDKMLESMDLEKDSKAEKMVIKKFRQGHPIVFSDVQRVADHIDHVVDLVGIEHIGLGSDFDGVGDTLPNGLKDVSDYPNLILELLRRGYTEEDIYMICSGNIFRVWNKVVEYAKTSNGS